MGRFEHSSGLFFIALVNPLAPTLGGSKRNLGDTPRPSAKGLRPSAHPCPRRSHSMLCPYDPSTREHEGEGEMQSQTLGRRVSPAPLLRQPALVCFVPHHSQASLRPCHPSGRAEGLRPSAFLMIPQDWGTKGADSAKRVDCRAFPSRGRDNGSQ